MAAAAAAARLVLPRAQDERGASLLILRVPIAAVALPAAGRSAQVVAAGEAAGEAVVGAGEVVVAAAWRRAAARMAR